jgi:hypothetical protein
MHHAPTLDWIIPKDRLAVDGIERQASWIAARSIHRVFVHL